MSLMGDATLWATKPSNQANTATSNMTTLAWLLHCLLRYRICCAVCCAIRCAIHCGRSCNLCVQYRQYCMYSIWYMLLGLSCTFCFCSIQPAHQSTWIRDKGCASRCNPSCLIKKDCAFTNVRANFHLIGGNGRPPPCHTTHVSWRPEQQVSEIYPHRTATPWPPWLHMYHINHNWRRSRTEVATA